MKHERSPYRWQEPRPPARPAMPWRQRINFALASLTMLMGSACFGLMCAPVGADLRVLLIGVGTVLFGCGFVQAVMWASGRSALRWWGPGFVVASLPFLLASHSGRCGDERERRTIAAVHAWRAAHGRYPASLAELPPEPRAGACRFAFPAGSMRYWPAPQRDDAELTRTLVVLQRRIYHFRERRITCLD